MSEQRRRNEKEEEKTREKEDEKRGEKNLSLEEKWRRDPIRLYTIAAMLIWGGIVALIDSFVTWEDGWAVFLIGAGVIMIIKAGIRMMPAYRRPAIGNFIIGVVLVGVGVGGVSDWKFVWPIILILIALVILYGATRRRG